MATKAKTILGLVLVVAVGCGSEPNADNPFFADENAPPLEGVQLMVATDTTYSLDEVKLEAIPTHGKGQLTFEWTINSTPLDHPANIYYFSRYATKRIDYTIDVQVTDSTGTSKSASTILRVEPHPEGAMMRIRNGSGVSLDEIYVYRGSTLR